MTTKTTTKRPYHRTAISRKVASLPAKWLVGQGLTGTEAGAFHPTMVLDYGCGRGTDCDTYGWQGWDPNTDRPEHSLEPALGAYPVVVSTYVANVIPEDDLGYYLDSISECLLSGGTAYISVRDDIPAHIEGNGQWSHDLTLWSECTEYHIELLHHNRGAFKMYTLRNA